MMKGHLDLCDLHGSCTGLWYFKLMVKPLSCLVLLKVGVQTFKSQFVRMTISNMNSGI